MNKTQKIVKSYTQTVNTDAIPPIVAETDNPLPTVALSIRQPWAWLIVHGQKDVENRTWPTRFRGRFLVHAAKRMTDAEWEDAMWFAEDLGVEVPPPRDLQFGGIIGEATLVDCVRNSSSDWFMGEFGFVLTDRKPLPFIPCRGALGFFRPVIRTR